jgi:hypothetical protein
MKPGDLRKFTHSNSSTIFFVVIDIYTDRFGNRYVNILLNGEISKDWKLDWLIKNSVAINETG